jgi:selenocysteine-specific elongation factor
LPRALGVQRGVIAITKCDLTDPAAAIDEASELMPGVDAVPVAAPAEAGLDALLAALDREAAGIPGRGEADGPVRLYVDRSFTLKGIGTVVTGTLWSGHIAAHERVRVLPQGRGVRIRSIQVHGDQVERRSRASAWLSPSPASGIARSGAATSSAAATPS